MIDPNDAHGMAALQAAFNASQMERVSAPLTQAEHVRRAAELPQIIAELRELRLELAARQNFQK